MPNRTWASTQVALARSRREVVPTTSSGAGTGASAPITAPTRWGRELSDHMQALPEAGYCAYAYRFRHDRAGSRAARCQGPHITLNYVR